MDVMVAPHSSSDHQIPEGGTLSLGVIIPTRDDHEALQACIRSLRDLVKIQEVIVVDASEGASADFQSAATDAPLRLIRSELAGRAHQMNLGANAAQSEILLFLHADTSLPKDAVPAIHDALADEAVIGGAFRMRLHPNSLPLRFIAGTVNLRSRWLQRPFGDQALFVRTKAFRSLNGFSEIPIMEDVELVRRLRRMGKLSIVASYVTTSSRRWRSNGILRTTLVNWLSQIMWKIGRSPEKIRAFYDRYLNRD